MGAVVAALIHKVVTVVFQLVLPSSLGTAFIIMAHDPYLFHMRKQKKKKKDVSFPLMATRWKLHNSDWLISRWPDLAARKAGKVDLL